MPQGPVAPPAGVAVMITLPPGMFGRKNSRDWRNQGPLPIRLKAVPRLSETSTLPAAGPPYDTAAISKLPETVLFSVTEIGGFPADEFACICTKLMAAFGVTSRKTES